MKIDKITLLKYGLFCLLLTFLSLTSLQAQLAFPTVKGAGASASGGRGGQVIHVTTLDWDAPGGLKEAIQTPGPRIIVFDVSGEIDATQEPAFSTIISGSQYNDITIAGQTAPLGGITIRTNFFRFGYVDNVIVRYIRFRHESQGTGADAIWLYSGSDIVIDHCTFSHGTDEAADMSTSLGSMGNITIQNCFFQDSKTGIILGADTGGYDPGDFSFINNVFSNISHRFPNPQGSGHYDIINNVVYNWKNRLIRITNEGTYNVVNNYYKGAANGIHRPGWFSNYNISANYLQKLQTQANDNPLIYAAGSVIYIQRETPQQNDSDMWTTFAGSHIGQGLPVPAQYFTDTQFGLNGEGFTIKSAHEAYNDLVLQGDVGAYKTLNETGDIIIYYDTKDAEDLLMIQNDSYNGSFFDPINSIPYPIIPQNTRPSDFDTNNDGMPDIWKISRGFQSDTDLSSFVWPSGYVGIEEYLNEIDEVGNNILIANAGNDQNICEGESAILTASGGSSYLWDTGETTASIEVSPTATTTYSVTVFDNDGNFDEDSVVITVNTIPIADAGEDETICEGDTITLTASGGTSYLWSNGETTASIQVSPSIDTVYDVEVTTNNCSSTDSVSVFVNEVPDLNVSDDVVLVQGNATILSVSGSDNYLWSTGETSSEITVAPLNTTIYSVTSVGSNGCSTTLDILVIVIPEVVANAGLDETICNNEEIILTAMGGSTYLWNTGATTSQIVVSPQETTTYTVTVTDDYGFSDVDSVTVTVDEAPNITVTEDVFLIEGESTLLSASGGENYLWSTGETSASITVAPNQTTTYTITSVSNNGCFTTQQILVTVEPLFIASAGEDRNVCENDTYEIQLTAGQGDSYVWSTGETTQSIIVSPLSTTTYTVTIVYGFQEDTDDVTVYVNPNPSVVILNGDSVNIMNGDFVTLSASGANSYEWNNGATQPNIAVSPSQTTTYEVRGFINDCYDEKQVTVNIIPEVEADAGEDVEICVGETVALTATGGDEYEWSTGEFTQSIEVSPNSTTEYTVTVYNELDFDEDSVIVFVNDNCDENNNVPEIPEETGEFKFDVFPNPADNEVNIKLSGSVELSRIYLYDTTGKLIYSEIISNESLGSSSTRVLDIGTLIPGVYYVKLEDRNKEIFKHLIIQ